jgi:hypothetical protein
MCQLRCPKIQNEVTGQSKDENPLGGLEQHSCNEFFASINTVLVTPYSNTYDKNVQDDPACPASAIFALLGI